MIQLPPTVATIGQEFTQPQCRSERARSRLAMLSLVVKLWQDQADNDK